MSEVKVNKISPRTNCGTTTLGDSGDSFVIPSGVTITNNGTQTGFGRTGTVDWNTTAITADPANAVSGTGYFANTTSAAFTITLPTSPSAGDIVAVRDYANTFATNNLTIGRNGQPIDGQTFDLVLDTNGQAITLVYVDGTQGWKSVNSNETINAARFVTATGGTVTCCGDYKIHTFTGPGTFTVTCAGNPAGSSTVDYLVVAGGGGGGTEFSSSAAAGGGGAGGLRASATTFAIGCAPAAPFVACVSALPVTTTGYPITVGAGGPTSNTPGDSSSGNGNNSVFSTITSTAGGGGGQTAGPGACNARDGATGGSGGGGGHGCFGGAGNTPPVSPPQGQPGGNAGPIYPGGGGGGAVVAGANGSFPGSGGPGGNGGGFPSAFGTSGEPSGGYYYFSGGGGGGGTGNVPQSTPAGTGGLGGGGNGGFPQSGTGQAGTVNTGGGGGGAANRSPPGPNVCGGAGGSGIVIIRYKYQ